MLERQSHGLRLICPKSLVGKWSEQPLVYDHFENMCVPAISGGIPLPLQIDTGSSETLISVSKLSEIHHAVIGSGTSGSWAGPLSVDYALLPSITTTFVSEVLPQVTSWPDSFQLEGGVLGLDTLSKGDFIMDLEQSIVRI